MPPPEFFATPGYGDRLRENFYYSQAVKVGNRIETAGQGGWNDDWEFPALLEDEIRQAFDNLTRTLKTAGAGWEHVIHVNSYHVDFASTAPAVNAIMSRLFRTHMPQHAPIWTCLGVTALGDSKMRVEIRVTAIIPE